MTATSSKPIVDDFLAKLSERVDVAALEPPLHLDNTHTFVILQTKNKGSLHAPIRGGLTEAGVEDVVKQLEATPTLKPLVRRLQ